MDFYEIENEVLKKCSIFCKSRADEEKAAFLFSDKDFLQIEEMRGEICLSLRNRMEVIKADSEEEIIEKIKNEIEKTNLNNNIIWFIVREISQVFGDYIDIRLENGFFHFIVKNGQEFYMYAFNVSGTPGIKAFFSPSLSSESSLGVFTMEGALIFLIERILSHDKRILTIETVVERLKGESAIGDRYVTPEESYDSIKAKFRNGYLAKFEIFSMEKDVFLLSLYKRDDDGEIYLLAEEEYDDLRDVAERLKDVSDLE